MAGELLAMRRAGVGAPISEYGVLVDRARVNGGGKGTRQSTVSTAASSLPGVAVTGDGVAHTKGAWTELIASTAHDAELVEVICRGVAQSTVNTSVLVDIGTGAAAAEAVLIPNLMTGYTNAATGYSVSFTFPVYVAAGTRLSARLQGAETSETEIISVRLHAAGLSSAPGSTVTAIGADTATSSGTLLTAPAGANTESAYTQITASTAADYRWLLIALSFQGASVAAIDGLVDIATGGSGSETEIISEIPFSGSTSELIQYVGTPIPHRVDIPAGTRIAARYQGTTTAAGSRPAVVVYGVS